MLTVKEFNGFGVEFVTGDICKDSDSGWVYETDWTDDIINFLYDKVTLFAWRPLNMLPDNPKFSYEINIASHQWRPLLDQSVDIYACDDFYDNSEITLKYVDALKSDKDKGFLSNISKQSQTETPEEKEAFDKMKPYDFDEHVSYAKPAINDIEYELSLHKANSELLASLTDFMVKNNIGKIGEGCIDVAIRELSEKYNIDTRTPKQNAVDEAALVIEMKHGSAGYAYKKYCETLYDAGLLKC